MSHQYDEKTENDIELIVEAVNKGVTLREIHGISEEQMQGLYGLAYDFYNKGKLEEAEKFFKFLCIYDFYNVDFLLGLAAVYQLSGMYQKASDLYAVAFAQADSDYRPMLYAGQCQLAMGKSGKARQCFKTVIEYANDEVLVVKALAYLEALKKESASNHKRDK